MLNSFDYPINSLAFFFAHCGAGKDQGNRFYSVAATIIKPGSPVQTFDSLVRYSLFSGRERLRSNLSREKLATAPTPSDAGKEVREFLQDQSFVFTFNGWEDLEEVKSFCGLNRLVDLNPAAEFFLPDLLSHTFKGLWEHLYGKKRGRIHFTAAEMVSLSMELLKHICNVRLNDNAFPHARSLRYYLEKSDTLFGSAFLHTARNFSRYFGGLFNPCAAPDTDDWQQFLERARPGKAEKPGNEPYRMLSASEISGRYQALSDNQKDFQYRSSQVEFAKCVAGAINENAILCLEAGTGTGKTLGYLIPVLDFLTKNPEARAVISTYTKNLQEQVFQREVAYVKEHFKLYENIPTAILKGKSSYLCARKLDYVLDEEVKGTQRLAWLYLVNLCYHFENADVDSMGSVVRRYLDGDGFLAHTLRTASSREGCPPSHERCPAQVVTARARDSRLIITNHHKLALLDMDPVLVGLFKNYLIDEANHFEHAIRNVYREEIASRDVAFSLSYLEKTTENFCRRASGENLRLLENLRTRVSTLRHALRELHAVLFSLRAPGVPGEERTLPAQHSAFNGGHIVNHLKKIRAEVIGIRDPLKRILDEDRSRMLKILPRTVGRLKNEQQFLGSFAESLSLFESAFNVQNRVQTYRIFRKHFLLSSAAVEVDEIIRGQVYQNRDWVIYTAATLRYRENFEVFKKIVGLDKPFETEGETRSLRFKAIPSPFSPQNMRMMIPDDAVSGNFSFKERWLAYLVRAIPVLIRKNRGRTLVLFASYSDLDHVAERVSESMADAMVPLLIQKPGQSTVHLCDDFMAVKESVLFGVDTFWYGVDFKGDTLTQVIITRIPFPSPLDPLQLARKAFVLLPDYFERYYYDTDTKLKQGIGRLIRSHTDSGKIVIMDSRKMARGYVDRHAAIIVNNGGRTSDYKFICHTILV